MKVYLVIDHGSCINDEPGYIFGVFSTEEKAKEWENDFTYTYELEIDKPERIKV